MIIEETRTYKFDKANTIIIKQRHIMQHVGKISKKDAAKSIRDAIIIGVGPILVSILEIVEATDFNEYTPLVAIICSMISPLIMRVGRNKIT